MSGMISENIARAQSIIEKSCRKSGRTSSAVTIVAVTKGVDSGRIQQAVEAGIQDLGENRVQEASRKIEQLSHLPVRWHFIGRPQTNKVKKAITLFQSIQSVDTIAQMALIQKHLNSLDVIEYPVLVQINLSGTGTQGGIEEEALIPFLEYGRTCFRLKIRGFMTIAPFGEEESTIRHCFQRLRSLLVEVNQQNAAGYPLSELSMGMSDDYALAVEEGATIVRLGRALFGERSV